MKLLNFWKELERFQKVFVGMVGIFIAIAVGVSIHLAEIGVIELNPMIIALIGVMVMSAIGMLVDMLRY